MKLEDVHREASHGIQPFPLLETRHLSKHYLTSRWPSARVRVTALEDICLSLMPRSTLALVGKSGAGKSALGRCLALLEAPDAGEIRFQGKDVLVLPKNERALIRRDIQLVFQQSATAMNPLFSAAEIVAEPLRIAGKVPRKECRERALELLKQVGIPVWSTHRTPLQFSGGQRQRIAIARALISQPKVLILDEALSGLDMRTQAQTANMLLEMQASLSLSLLFISHDLRMAAYLADTMAVIEYGRIIETGSVAEVFSGTRRKETRELIDAIPEVPETAAHPGPVQ